MKALQALAQLIERLKRLRLVQLFTIYLRYGIGSAFVYASIPKILGERFTRMPVETPVGFFFEAMYQSGFYWNFLGWGQMIAALLIMTQRFATAGALMFYPIIINIWLITWSMGFRGCLKIQEHFFTKMEMKANWLKAKALWVVTSISTFNLRYPCSQAKLRSTRHRIGTTWNFPGLILG